LSQEDLTKQLEQLQRLLAEDPALVARLVAQVTGSGAVAQAGGVAAGERGVGVGGALVDSVVVTGDGNVTINVGELRVTLSPEEVRSLLPQTPLSPSFTTHIGSVTGPVHTGEGDIRIEHYHAVPQPTPVEPAHTPPAAPERDELPEPGALPPRAQDAEGKAGRPVGFVQRAIAELRERNKQTMVNVMDHLVDLVGYQETMQDAKASEGKKAPMSRRTDLEEHIRGSYDIIRQYEEIVQTSNRPEEVQRARRKIKEQRALIAGYLREYRRVVGDAMPADIAEVAAGLPESESPPRLREPEREFDPDELPEPGPLPPGSHLPFHRNALFTGRTEPLKKLARALLRDGATSTLVTQAVQGMGGVGKTQLAVEFAHRYGRFFHGVHWLNGAQPGALGADVAVCGEAMALPGWPQKQPEQVERTLEEWRRGGPRLVVLDNLEKVAAARAGRARLSGGAVRVLLTARRADWPRDLGLRPLRLEVFTPEESHEFLRRYLPEERAGATDADVDGLAERLGHLPLALVVGGR